MGDSPLSDTPRATADEADDVDALRRRDFLLYDGECPVCRRYVLWTSVRERHPDIALLDARRNPRLVAAVRAEGIEVNDTMLLHVGGRGYTGAAAMAKLGEYAPRDTLRQRLLKGLAASRLLSDATYPWLVRGRKALLRLLGRDEIR